MCFTLPIPFGEFVIGCLNNFYLPLSVIYIPIFTGLVFLADSSDPTSHWPANYPYETGRFKSEKQENAKQNVAIRLPRECQGARHPGHNPTNGVSMKGVVTHWLEASCMVSSCILRCSWFLQNPRVSCNP